MFLFQYFGNLIEFRSFVEICVNFYLYFITFVLSYSFPFGVGDCSVGFGAKMGDGQCASFEKPCMRYYV